jgi:hypothetical protein
MEEEILRLINNSFDPRDQKLYTVVASREIMLMFSRFITWMYMGCNQFVLHDIKDADFYNIEDHTVWTLEQVFIYWRDNILNKKNGLSRTKFNHN